MILMRRGALGNALHSVRLSQGAADASRCPGQIGEGDWVELLPGLPENAVLGPGC